MALLCSLEQQFCLNVLPCISETCLRGLGSWVDKLHHLHMSSKLSAACKILFASNCFLNHGVLRVVIFDM